MIIGYGWRAQFYYRIAKALPDEFEVCAALVRTKERASQIESEQGVFATDRLTEALAKAPDFAVLCINRSGTRQYLEMLAEHGVPVLCETPPAKDIPELGALMEGITARGGKVQVAEQYFLQPLYAALLRIISQGVIGEVSNISLSAVHGYHAVSIFRKVLGVGFSTCRITGRRFLFPVTVTGSRDGVDTSGTIKRAKRNIVTFEFENDKTAFLDFASEQYHSSIRTRRLNIQGVRGEINDMTLRCLNADNEAYTSSLHRIDDGIYDNNGWTHRGIQWGDAFVYRNPFAGARLNDDEIAIADCLRHMKRYVDTGEEFYPLAEALQDTYLAFLMEEAITTGRTVESEEQNFNRIK